ncbi:SQR/QFR domain-containing protein [Trifolium repens]|nr:SQR/QFR domain-containing protein [Trifolium repens]
MVRGVFKKIIFSLSCDAIPLLLHRHLRSPPPPTAPHPILTTSSLFHGLPLKPADCLSKERKSVSNLKKIEKECDTDLNEIKVRVGNLIENQGRAYEILKPYNSHEGLGKATIKLVRRCRLTFSPGLLLDLLG